MSAVATIVVMTVFVLIARIAIVRRVLRHIMMSMLITRCHLHHVDLSSDGSSLGWADAQYLDDAKHHGDEAYCCNSDLMRKHSLTNPSTSSIYLQGVLSQCRNQIPQ